MTLQQLKYVIGISKAGSFNKAGEQMFISQPSLTASVHELEKELGIVIFNRTGRGVSLTNDGTEFLSKAKQLYMNYEALMENYGTNGKLKKKYGISCQHYSFVLKSFVEMVKNFNTEEYEFAIRETKTREVIEDVASLKSEIGVLYLSDFNRKVILNLLAARDIEFHFLIECSAFVYLWKGHPLAEKKEISLKELEPYPCLSFEQGEESSFYFAEEILSTEEYHRTIKANDRASILNLMVGLNGYTLCSGIISPELNGSDYIVIPLKDGDGKIDRKMEIGYITKKNFVLNSIGESFINEMKKYLGVKI